VDSTSSYDHLSRPELIQSNQSLESEVRSLQAITQTQQSQIQNQQFKIDALTHELAGLKKLVYGSRSERFVPTDPPAGVQQGTLDLEVDTVATRTVASQKITYTRSQVITTPLVHPGRNPLPDYLPRQEVLIQPQTDITGGVKIGEEVTEQLELREQEIYVLRYVRPKYLVKNEQETRIIIAPPPPMPLPKCIAGPGLLAQVVIDKYVDHLPLHRQMQRFDRAGVNLSYSTLTGWVRGVCELIEPLFEAHKKEVLATSYLHADETPIKVLDKQKKGTSHRGFLWVYHNSLKKIVLFDYQQGRSGDYPTAVLKDFSGHLQTDGYGAYEHLDGAHGITLMHCMAHGRRKFEEALDNDQFRAGYALEQIQQLYAIERQCREGQMDFDQIKEVRQLKAAPILENMKGWMTDQYPQVLPKSGIGQAIAYNLKRWDRLSIYIRDGSLSIDNNPVENTIRPVALGRKNYLFCGSHEAATRTALLYSLVGTCKLHGINPLDWLKDLLIRIPEYPVNRIQDLLPQHSHLKSRHQEVHST